MMYEKNREGKKESVNSSELYPLDTVTELGLLPSEAF